MKPLSLCLLVSFNAADELIHQAPNPTPTTSYRWLQITLEAWTPP